ncbi:chemotaxis protein CheB [Azohydromonas caseinilytica]|uniref:chemotaxis protein CheB n=1 Tax=Azohydromonas caseinilytica TaxID=2728836 RepID=UPI002174D800|nr:chemotaxis protein CheB [Azohydromonas caseinilytica]
MPRRDIVVIGASAGGVHALRVVAAGLSADFAAAVCVVLHIGAHESTLPALLEAVGPLPAAHACFGPRDPARAHPGGPARPPPAAAG